MMRDYFLRLEVIFPTCFCNGYSCIFSQVLLSVLESSFGIFTNETLPIITKLAAAMDEKKSDITPTKTLQKKNTTKREKYIDKLTKQLKEWDKELEVFEQKSEERLTGLRKNLSQRIEKLRDKRNELRTKLDQLGDVSEEAFKDIKVDSEKLWNDIKQGFKKVRKEMKK